MQPVQSSQQQDGQAPSFSFVVKVVDGIDAGRDVCRLHPEALTLLGIRPWEPILMQGKRAAAALAGFLDWQSHRQLAVIDSLAAANLAVQDGDYISIAPVAAIPAQAVWLAPLQATQLPVDALRTALLGKAVIVGEHESLLPQDYNRAFTHEAAAGLNTLRQLLGPQFRTTQVTVTRTEPPGVVLIAATTRIHWEGESPEANVPAPSQGPDTAVTLSDIGGLGPQVGQLREILELAFHHGDLLARLGTAAPHGVLLQGPHGSGKSEMVYAVAADIGARVVRVSGIDLEFRAADAQATAIRQAFGAQGSAQGGQAPPPGAAPGAPAGMPTVVLVQDVERLAPAERDAQGAVGAVLLQTLDSVKDRADLITVGTTTAPESCDPALFEPGRLDRRIDIPMPDRAGRHEILLVHSRSLPLGPDVDLSAIAARTPGFVGSDIAKLCHHAALHAAARLKNVALPDPALVSVTAVDFDQALQVVRPSALGTGPLDTGDVTFADVGDTEALKEALTETVLWPLRYPDTFARLSLDPPRGVLLYGPPGCGKTYVVRALANESAANLIAVKGAELLSKWVGESEAGVRELFRRARACAPSIVFLDEIDALAPARGQSMDSGVTDRVVAQLLTELDGIEPMRGVAVIGATNRPDLIDPALLRPGRLERHVFVDPPDAAARQQILAAICRKMPIAPGIDLSAIAAAAAGFSAADLEALAREAGFTAMRRNPDAATIDAVDFDAAARKVKPSIDDSVVTRLREFANGTGG